MFYKAYLLLSLPNFLLAASNEYSFPQVVRFVPRRESDGIQVEEGKIKTRNPQRDLSLRPDQPVYEIFDRDPSLNKARAFETFFEMDTETGYYTKTFTVKELVDFIIRALQNTYLPHKSIGISLDYVNREQRIKLSLLPTKAKIADWVFQKNASLYRIGATAFLIVVSPHMEASQTFKIFTDEINDVRYVSKSSKDATVCYLFFKKIVAHKVLREIKFLSYIECENFLWGKVRLFYSYKIVDIPFPTKKDCSLRIGKFKIERSYYGHSYEMEFRPALKEFLQKYLASLDIHQHLVEEYIAKYEHISSLRNVSEPLTEDTEQVNEEKLRIPPWETVEYCLVTDFERLNVNWKPISHEIVEYTRNKYVRPPRFQKLRLNNPTSPLTTEDSQKMMPN